MTSLTLSPLPLYPEPVDNQVKMRVVKRIYRSRYKKDDYSFDSNSVIFELSYSVSSLS